MAVKMGIFPFLKNYDRNAVLRYANWGVFINQEWRIGAPPGT